MAFLSLILTPTCLILGGLYWRDQIPDLPRGIARESVAAYGDFSVNRYQTASREEFYDLTVTQNGKTKVLIDRLTAYRLENSKLYACGMTGNAVISSGTGCLLVNNSGFDGYGHGLKTVKLLQTIRAFPAEDFSLLEAMPEELTAYPTPNPIEFQLGSGRFRIEAMDGRMILVDALARELHAGYTIRLFSNVHSYLLKGTKLYVRASRGFAVLDWAAREYRVYFDDYGIKSYYSAYTDIQTFRYTREFGVEDQKILKALPLRSGI